MDERDEAGSTAATRDGGDAPADAPSVRVVLVEDHGIVREGLRLILQRTPAIVVAGEAGDGLGGVRLCEQLLGRGTPVDVLVTDLDLPDIGGLEVARRVKALRPATRVLLLTMHADDEHVRGMLTVGADGYLLKQAAARELAAAIHAVARGETALSPAIARRLVNQIQRGGGGARRSDVLTGREREVLGLLAGGGTSKEIAQRLGLSTKTVENHRARILEKLGVANTAAAVSLGHHQHLIPPSDE